MERLLFRILTTGKQKILEEDGGVDFAHVVGDDECRFRVNLFKQRGNLALVARRVNNKIPTFEDLGLPPSIEKLCHFDQGMVILAGVTGSGKSTTIASMLDYINEREPLHILTIEDPIEYMFTDKKSVINQREVGIDVRRLAQGPQARGPRGPRRHPGRRNARPRDVRGRHSRGRDRPPGVRHHSRLDVAASTISRILDLFPPDMHPAIRQALAFNLKAVVAQKLLPSDQARHARACRRTRS